MDPTEALTSALAALLLLNEPRDGDTLSDTHARRARASECLDGLAVWLEAGGFAPDVATAWERASERREREGSRLDLVGLTSLAIDMLDGDHVDSGDAVDLARGVLAIAPCNPWRSDLAHVPPLMRARWAAWIRGTMIESIGTTIDDDDMESPSTMRRCYVAAVKRARERFGPSWALSMSIDDARDVAVEVSTWRG